MNLNTYRASQFSSAFEAQEQGGLYLLRVLDVVDEITLKILDRAGVMMEADFHIAIDSAINAFACTGEDSYRFVLTDGKVPKFEYNPNTEAWSKIQTLEELNREETKASTEYIENLDYEVYITRNSESESDYLVTVITANGETDSIALDVGDENTLKFGNEDFDFFLEEDDEGNFSLSLYNLITNSLGDPSRRMAEDSMHWPLCNVVDASTLSKKLLESKDKQIDEQLKKIEQWSENYCGPLVNGAGPEGDDIFQAIHAMRKIINIGYEEYDKLVADAKAK